MKYEAKLENGMLIKSDKGVDFIASDGKFLHKFLIFGNIFDMKSQCESSDMYLTA